MNCLLRLLLFMEPLGAVDEATDPFWRLILDFRRSNEFQNPWGVCHWFFSIWQLAALLDHGDVMFAEDLEDAYHHSPAVASQHGLRPLFLPGLLRHGHERLLH